MRQNATGAPDTLIFGATGFLGRWTLLHLLEQGRDVAAVVRDPTRDHELRAWLREHGTPAEQLTVLGGDLTSGRGVGLSPADDERLAGVRDVFNTAALYRFGLRREEARAVNVEGALNVLRWAATRPALRRLVHVTGYRAGLEPHPRHPLPEAELVELYRDKGAYEGSKIEGDAALRVVAAQLGTPLTVVNPSSVIGHSATGEAGQYIGLAELVRDLWQGGLPVLPGTARTFVPVVSVDHFAKFMASLPEHDPEPGGLHWVLDRNTPDLPDLLRLLAGHLGVRAPRTHVPVSLIRRLPTALTGANPETLTFLTEDRYDTASAERVAETAGLRPPPVQTALRRWADRLVADRFGAAPATFPGGFHGIGGSRTYLAGDRTSPDFVLLHGIPLDGESWQPLLSELNAPALVADLPGLGRSTPSDGTPLDWLTQLLAPVRTRPVIVAHSAAAAPALRYAAAHPGRVAGLLLISPYFLQKPAPRLLRTPRLAAPLLAKVSAERLATSLLGPDSHLCPNAARDAVESAAAQLRRPRVAHRTATWLRAANRPAERAALRALLSEAASVPVPLHLVAGQLDPLIADPGPATVTTIPGTGHHPHLTHPSAIADLMTGGPFNAPALRTTP
ncbi:alpha/beta fold hydrolase [Nonomuraea sp. SBT364]|uniref:alpha/beta fold hydrolase n=1 Tax=Nonomuraea sp. SBT364 TaxID=1580530 RepID=UPI00069F8830|nr:alpha/beta fold hydrolase [Nonomuraea sp. SBT364]